MYCPYIKKSETWYRMTEWKHSDVNEAVVKEERTSCQTIYEMAECERENCGAFYDGKCNYKGAITNG